MLPLRYLNLLYIVFSDLRIRDPKSYKGQMKRNKSARSLWGEDQKSPRSNVLPKKTRKKSTILANDEIIQINLASDESYEMNINEEIDIDRHAMYRDLKEQPDNRKRKTAKIRNWQIYRSIQQIMDEELIEEDKHNDFNDQTPTPLVRQNQRLQPEEILFQKNLQIPDIIAEYKNLYERDPHTDNYNLQLIHVQGWEEIVLNHTYYKDQYLFLKLRKFIVTFFDLISLICQKITTNIVSNFVMLLLVCINMTLYITKFYQNLYTEYQSLFDGWSLSIFEQILVFFWIYVIEHGIKIIGLGLVKFLQNFWNCYDLANLILFGLYIYGSLNFDFSPLRAMRILIQLGKMSTQLHKTLKALTESLKYMMEASLVVLIFCIFFANVGVHLFSELFQNKCFDIELGIPDLDEQICGWIHCPNGMSCYKSLSNIDQATNFDNFFLAFAQILRTITMDNWTDVMYYTMYTLSPMTWIYFILVIFIVGFFAFNLIIAVLKTYYSQIVSNYQEGKEQLTEDMTPSIEPLNLRYIKNIGLYNSIKTLQKVRKQATIQQSTAMSYSISNDHHQIFSPKGSMLLTKQKVQQQFTSGFGQVNRLQKMVKRAKTVKEKKKQLRLVLSARQQKLLKERENEELGILNTERSIFDNCNLKSILQPIRNFNLDQSRYEQVTEGDVKGKKILNSLKQHDILAWKLEVKYDPYIPNSKREVISEKWEIQEKARKLKEQYEKVKQQNLMQYYMVDIQTKKEKRQLSQEHSFQRLYSIKLEQNSTMRPREPSQTKIRFPVRKSQRMLLSQQLSVGANEIPSNKSTLSRKTYYEQLRKTLTSKIQRAQSEVMLEFPEWQEGQAFILINGVKWNLDACIILLNRGNGDFDSSSDEEIDKNYEQFIRIRKNESKQGFIRRHNISIQNVLNDVKKTKLISILRQLNRHQYNIWIEGICGFLKVCQFKLRSLLQQTYVQIIFDLLTMLNFIVLCSDGFSDADLVTNINSVMTFFLLGEICIKILGWGIENFVRKFNNVLDACIVILCLLQYFISIIQPPWLQKYSSEIRALRAFKALMLYRVIKYNQFVVRIMRIAQLTVRSYVNLTFLMFFVIFMYAIMGLQFFVNKFDETQKLAQLHSFNSIAKSWMTVFNVITNDDAIGMLKVATQYTDTWVALLFYFLTVFGINYLIYGLVSAVLLDAFSSELEKDDQTEEKRERILEQLAIEEDINKNDTKVDTLTSQQTLNDTSDDEDIELKQRQQQIIKRQTLNSRKTVYQQLPHTVKHIFIQQNPLDFEYYKDIECQYSLFLFHFDSIFRKFCYRVTKSMIFKFILNISICSSVATMIIVSFDDNLPSLHTNHLNTFYEYHLFGVNILIAITYLLEIIAQGMLLDQGAFCRDFWRFIDILYLLNYYLSFVTTTPFLKFTQYLIYLRPLMMINMFESIKGIKNAMSLSLIQILNVIGVILLVFLIFDVFAMHLYQNKMGFCESDMNFNINYEECQGQGLQWIVNNYNFDNILQGLLTLFTIASLDGWGQVMQVCYNSNDAKYGPYPLKNQWATYLFFILFIFIGAMFFMGFLTGVLFTEFQKYTKQLENKYLAGDQSKFLKITELILEQSPGYSNPPKSPLRRLCYTIVFSQFYHYFFIFILVCNTILLCLFYANAPYDYMKNLNTIYQVLTAFFAFDTIIKLLAYGPTRYFSTNWRVIELCLSFLAVADFVYDTRWSWFDHFLVANQNDQYFTVYRILFSIRDIRILLIIQEFKGLLRLLRVLQFSMPLLMKILYISVIAQTTYALLGKELFGHITKGGDIDNEYANFKNFVNAALIMFKCTSGDDWTQIMIDCSPQNMYCYSDPTQCGSQWSLPFFLSYYLFSNIIIMNLFVLALVDQFESINSLYLDFFNTSINAIQTYVENVDHFCNVWCKYTYETRGNKMHTRFIARFLLDLKEPLGALNGDNIWDAAKSASNFRIRANKKGYVYFNELLYETIHFAFKETVFKSGALVGRSQMKQYDMAMKRRIMEQAQQKDEEIDSGLVAEQSKYKYQNFNILSEYLNVLIALKTWQAYTYKLIEKTKNYEEYTEQSSFSDKDKEDSIQKEISRTSQNRLPQSIDLDDARLINGQLGIYKESKLYAHCQNLILLEPISRGSMQENTTLQKSPSTFLDNQSIQKMKLKVVAPPPGKIQKKQPEQRKQIQSFKDVIDKVF